MLSFIRGIENFESPLFFGPPAGIRVITTDIYDSINQRRRREYQYATAIGFAIMALMFLMRSAAMAAAARPQFQTVTGKGYSPNVMKLGAWRWVTFAVLHSVLRGHRGAAGRTTRCIGSFFKFFGFYSWDMLTLDHYRAVAAEQRVLARLQQHHAAGPRRRHRDDGARRHRRLRLGRARSGAAGG